MKECSVLQTIESKGEASQDGTSGRQNHQKTYKRGGDVTIVIEGLQKVKAHYSDPFGGTFGSSIIVCII
jgi:hypothetical protein